MKRGKISTNLSLISVFSTLITAVAVFCTVYFQLFSVIQHTEEKHASDSLNHFRVTVDSYLESAENSATGLASYKPFIDAFSAEDRETTSAALYAAVDEYYKFTGMTTDCITITDNAGVVYFRYYSDKKDDDISNLLYVQNALNGKVTTEVSKGTNIQLGARTGAPAKNAEGKVCGVISITYPLDSETLVDEMKGDSDNEYTVFMDNTRINTTVMNGGQRAVGTTMGEDVAKIVLENQEEYLMETEILGGNYMAAYSPLIDSTGTTVGAIFCGLHTDEATEMRTQALIISIGVAVLVAVISIFSLILYTKKSISKPVNELCASADQIAHGNLKIQIANGPNNEIGTLSDSLKEVVANLNVYISDISENMNLIANGDMTSEITREYVGDFAEIKTSINKIVEELNGTLLQINTAADQVNSGADQVATAAQALSQGATEQASSIEELAATINVVSEQINTNAQEATDAKKKSHLAGDYLSDANSKMNELVAAMQEISTSSDETKKIIKTIEDIAFQTNILALNAAVEASRAGEAGKGFAVVADEVRNLAAKSAEAANNTTHLIEDTVTAIDKGTLLVEEVSGKLSGVATAANEVAVINEKIEESSKLSAESINQITVGVDQISTVVQTNSATSEETAAASEELSGQAQMLQEEIGRFNLKGGSTRRPAAAFRPEPVAPAQPSKPLVPPSASNITINLDDDKY